MMCTAGTAGMRAAAARSGAARSCLRAQSTRPMAMPMARRNVRFQHSMPQGGAGGSNKSHSTSGVPPHILAGFIGGLVAVSGGYLWYSWSGTKTVVDTLRSGMQTLESAKSTVKDQASKVPTPSAKSALEFVRSTANAYSAFLPEETRRSIDSAFDSLDGLVAAGSPHAEEVDRIVKDTYGELREVFSQGGFDVETAERVRSVVEEKSRAIRRLLGDVGQDILDRNPKLGEWLKTTGDSAALNELRRVAEGAGGEGREILQAAYAELNELLKGEGKTDPATLYKAAGIIREKTTQARELGRRSAERAWEEAYENFSRSGGLMEALPEDVQSLLSDNIEPLKRTLLSGTGAAGVYELFGMIRKYATSSGEDTESSKKLREYLERKVRDATEMGGTTGSGLLNEKTFEKAARMLEEYIRTVPGGEKMLRNTPPLRELFEIASRSKSPEARRLAEETVEELGEVLSKRIEQARRLLGEGAGASGRTVKVAAN